MWFKKKDTDEKTVNSKGSEVKEEAKEETPKPVGEWIWVTGYKGTDKDMKCRDYQYEMNKCFDIPDDVEVEKCAHGFHLCKNLKDVYKFYPIDNGNRFFEVRALVRKEDYESYIGGNGQRVEFRDRHALIVSGYNKLVSKSIIFVRELTVDEILAHYNDISDWSDDDKRLIIDAGIDKARFTVNARKLVEVGYSETFAKIIARGDKFNIAYTVGTQEDLSMDMRVWAIYNHEDKKVIKVG